MKLNILNIDRIQSMPLRAGGDIVGDTQRLISSICDTCSDIFAQCDGPNVTLQSASWVPGWERPLAKALRQAVSHGKHSTGATLGLVDDFVRELQRDLADGVAGPTAFQSLLWNVS